MSKDGVPIDSAGSSGDERTVGYFAVIVRSVDHDRDGCEVEVCFPEMIMN